MTVTQAQLNALLARHEMEELIRQLQVLCLGEPYQKWGNELILLVSRYHKFEAEKDNLYPADREVALNQIKSALRDFIHQLDLPPGDLRDQNLLKKDWRSWQQTILDSPWRWSFLVLMLSALLLGLGQIRVQETAFQLEAKVHKLGLRTVQGWNIGDGYDLFLKKLELEYATQVSVIPELPTEAFLRIEQGRIQLNGLLLRPGQSLSLEQDKAEVILSVPQGGLEVSLDLLEARLSSPDTGLDQWIGKPATGEESVNIQTSSAAKVWLSACDTCRFRLPDVFIDSLDFTYRPESTVVSSIESGELKIGDRTQTLQSGDWLHLAHLRADHVMIEPGLGVFSVVLSGKAQQIRTEDPLGKTQQLMPTYLQYFRQNQGFLFYFSALSALFAALFPLRSWFKKK